MTDIIKNFWKDEEGATAIEYGIIAGLMALMLVAIFGTDGAVRTTLEAIFTKVKTVATTGA